MYSPTRDAEEHFDRLSDEADRIEHNMIEAGNEIRQAFDSKSPVPYVTGEGKVRYMPFEEAVSDIIQHDDVFAKLIDVLNTSDCMKVKAFIKIMAQKHVNMWADEIGEAR